jgi:predicted pyridoxine 5'-phosphate oxidase superfamily flavin-nucleotide-binding protein
MVKVPEEAKAVFDKERIIPLATVDKAGKPNVVMVAFWWWVDDEHVAVVENFLQKTHDNLAATKWGCMVAYDMSVHKSYQIKCKAEYLTSGPLFDEGRKRVEEFMKNNPMEMPGRAVWKLKVEELYFTAPGPNAGKRLA